MRLGVIRVITTEDPASLNSHGRILAQELGIETISRCLPDQPHGVHDAATFEAASVKTAELAEHMAAHDAVDALLISCAADPGLAEARQRLSIPVIGAGSAAARLALRRGTRVGVLDLTPETPAAVRSVLGEHYLGARVPQGITTSADLQKPGSTGHAVAAARELVSEGADVIMFACTGMTTINLIEPLREHLGVPIIDAVRAGGKAALEAADPPA